MSSILLQSIQPLFLEMRFNGNALSSGTGFVVESAKGPLLITNLHNVTGRNPHTGQPLSPTGGIPNQILVLHNKKDRLGEWTPRVEQILDSKGRPLWREHPTLGKRADIVALPLTSIQDVQLYPVNISEGTPPIPFAPSDYVSVVGFPFGLKPGLAGIAIWATGFIASEPFGNYDDLPVFLIDCRGRPGQSGSPVILHRNGGTMANIDGNTAILGGTQTRFLGVYSGRINDQSDLGMVWKAQAVRELIASV